MNIVKHVTKSVGLVAAAAVTVGIASSFATAAFASPVPPVAQASLVGTWVNTNAATRSVKQIDIVARRGGNIAVDAFGACTPTACQWGLVPANVYGPNVSSTSGAAFQTDQAFFSGKTEWSRTQLQGSVRRTAVGLRLTVRELTAFEDGSGRHNYTVTETFKPGRGPQPSTTGISAAGYPLGDSPLLIAGALGTWVNPTPNGGLVKVVVGGTQSSPSVEGFGQCSPSACDFGTVSAAAYGSSVSAPVGATALASYSFGFKNEQLVLRYWLTGAGDERLTVTTYNEFTDGSGRSNYTTTATLVRA